MTNKIELIIFDCDGVLIDSEIISAQVLIEQLLPLGVEINMAYVQQHFLGCSFSSVKEKLDSAFNIQLANSFEEEYRIALLGKFSTGLKATQGITGLLPHLAIPFCLATSSSPTRTDRALNIVGLDRFFCGKVFTAAEVENGKPAPDLFLHAAKTMQVAPQHCLVIEDSVAGVSAAVAAGMQVIHYQGGLHMTEATSQAIATTYPETKIMRHWQDFLQLQPKLITTNTNKAQRRI
ncbi:HAD-IA family hydrolase [Colwellia sp. E2M01]|uniref:HAD family hydrolase n=1 Tax=Colwellia sp. E2M01 TaxID=2841561 RepID=UPI001C08A85D|nr:HAD-IA family hydrolase [Colwellia sp. E2M01]